MKPVGATVHFRRGTVNWTLARWLALGSVPAAFAGVFVLNELGSGDEVAKRVKTLLGWPLIVAAVSMVARAFLATRARVRSERHDAAQDEPPSGPDATDSADVPNPCTRTSAVVSSEMHGIAPPQGAPPNNHVRRAADRPIRPVTPPSLRPRCGYGCRP